MKALQWALLGAVAGFLCMAPQAQAQENQTIKGILGAIGLGGDDDEKEPILYRERAPLVLPPKIELRQPAAPIETMAERNPAWPNDPEVVARKKREAAKRAPAGTSEKTRMLDDYGSTRVPIGELAAGDRRVSAETGPARYRYDRGREDTWVHPDVLKSQGRLSDNLVEAGTEPSRQALTQPPSGYRSSALPIKRGFETATRDEERDSARTFTQQQRQR